MPKSIKAKRKGWLPKDASIQYRIVLVLINAEKALNNSEIARELKATRQMVAHHLPKMIEKGLIIKTEDKKYHCQKILLNAENLLDRTWPLINELAQNLDYDQCKDAAEALIENLTCFFALMSFEDENNNN